MVLVTLKASLCIMENFEFYEGVAVCEAARVKTGS